jgi:hypothetical protein
LVAISSASALLVLAAKPLRFVYWSPGQMTLREWVARLVNGIFPRFKCGKRIPQVSFALREKLCGKGIVFLTVRTCVHESSNYRRA